MWGPTLVLGTRGGYERRVRLRSTSRTQRVHDMGSPLGPKCIPYTYMDPLGEVRQPTGLRNLS